MHRIIHITVLFLLSYTAVGQNLLVNGDFEYGTCPVTTGDVGRCRPWTRFHKGSSDYFRDCSPLPALQVPGNFNGYQPAVSGYAYMGLATYFPDGNFGRTGYKEYLESPMQVMEPGTIYEVSFSVSLADKSFFSTDDLGVMFYKDYQVDPSDVSAPDRRPQVSYKSYGFITDKDDWQRLVKYYAPDSTYDRIVIGGFDPYTLLNKTVTYCNDSTHAAYFYIDSVVVKPAAEIRVEFSDSVYCKGSTFKVDFFVTPGNFFKPGNVFKMELSDANGSFSSPTIIGSVSATGSGSMTVAIPTPIVSSPNYRVRLMSSNPELTIPLSDKKFLLENTIPEPIASASTPVCKGFSFTLSASSTTPVQKYTWTGPGINGGVAQKDVTINDAQLIYSGVYQIKAEYNKCVAYDTVYVEVHPIPSGRIESNEPICEGDTLQLHVFNDLSETVNKWKGPAGIRTTTQHVSLPDIKPENAGLYEMVYSLNGCADSSFVLVDVVSRPNFDLGPNQLLCEGDKLEIRPAYHEARYIWNDGSDLPTYTIVSPGKYWVTVSNQACGSYSDTVNISFEKCDCKTFVPSAFTPNNDGKNDMVGAIVSCEFSSFDLVIVNRFGEIVFQAKDISQKWDGTYKGTPSDIDTYFYLIKIDGPRGKKFLFKGDIALVR